MSKGGKQDELQPIIVKKVIKKGGGHHGGAWKVAYADFVTAMMAFFLLLWLLNVSTEEALEVISSYFDPSHPTVATSVSGAGGVMGGLTISPEGAMTQNKSKPVPPENSGSKQTGKQTKDSDAVKQLEEQLRKEENARFEQAKKELEEQLKSNPELQELAKHLKIDITPEGLRIQIIDQEGKPMFASGSADMLPSMRTLMDKVADVIIPMPNNASIRGHTDGVPYPAGATYTNWELSADRANAARRALIEDDFPKSRLGDVMGKADTEHLNEDNPTDPQNRRISIIMLRESVNEAYKRGAFEGMDIDDKTESAIEDSSSFDYLPQIDDSPTGSFEKTPGSVYFP